MSSPFNIKIPVDKKHRISVDIGLFRDELFKVINNRYGNLKKPHTDECLAKLYEDIKKKYEVPYVYTSFKRRFFAEVENLRLSDLIMIMDIIGAGFSYNAKTNKEKKLRLRKPYITFKHDWEIKNCNSVTTEHRCKHCWARRIEKEGVVTYKKGNKKLTEQPSCIVF